MLDWARVAVLLRFEWRRDIISVEGGADLLVPSVMLYVRRLSTSTRRDHFTAPVRVCWANVIHREGICA